jgi:hypothetical protein
VGGPFEAPALASDGVENVATDVERIIVEFDSNTGGAGEESVVDTTDFRPAAFQAAERRVDGDVLGGRPVVAHEDDVSSVESSIKLYESVTRMSEITKVFITGDGIKGGGKSG